MKNKLQYAYSITVFFGVLVTTYLMMNKEGNARVPLQALQSPQTLRSEASLVDPAVSQLFQMQDEISHLPVPASAKAPAQQAVPSPGNFR